MTTLQKHDKTVAALIHLSTFSQFFFPLGNFFFPLLLWTARKSDPFVNEHGKQALNFQISLYLYTVFLIAVGFAGAVIIGYSTNITEPFYFTDDFNLAGTPGEALPIIIYIAILAMIFLGLLIVNIVGVISATMKAGEGEYYSYPLSINFLNAAKRTGKADIEITKPEEDAQV